MGSPGSATVGGLRSLAGVSVGVPVVALMTRLSVGAAAASENGDRGELGCPPPKVGI